MSSTSADIPIKDTNLENKIPNEVETNDAADNQASRTTPLLKAYPGQAKLPSLTDIQDTHKGSGLPLKNIQADIFVGMKKPLELLYFFHINNPSHFKAALKTHVVPLVTSTEQILSPPRFQPLAFLNIAFSSSGLHALGVTEDLGDPNISNGQFEDAPSLGDDVALWDSAFAGTIVHGVFLIGSDEQRHIDSLLHKITKSLGASIKEIRKFQGAARPGSEEGHEHFGFLDGISNPAIDGFATHTFPGQNKVPSGTILTGRPGDSVTTRPSWALDGSFLAFRKLQQFVPEFHQYTKANAVQTPRGGLTPEQGAELLAARMIGRWKSGAPIDITPLVDDPALGADPERNNNFSFAHPGSLIDSDQLRCPFSAHIRKTRPRADLTTALGNPPEESPDHQAIRAGIPYGPEVSCREAEFETTLQEHGLLFVEYQSNIANGFRFQQSNWANASNFPPKKVETVGLDPIIGQAGGDASRDVDGLDPANAAHSLSIPQFVKPLGGEYFFTPSISALKNTISA